MNLTGFTILANVRYELTANVQTTGTDPGFIYQIKGVGSNNCVVGNGVTTLNGMCETTIRLDPFSAVFETGSVRISESIKPSSASSVFTGILDPDVMMSLTAIQLTDINGNPVSFDDIDAGIALTPTGYLSNSSVPEPSTASLMCGCLLLLINAQVIAEGIVLLGRRLFLGNSPRTATPPPSLVYFSAQK